MCGRFVLADPGRALARLFALALPAGAAPRWNIAPLQRILAVRAATPPGAPSETFAPSWGLVPRWAVDDRAAAKLINARAETAADKPAFREAFRRRRCVVPADGFYEWARPGRKPFLFALADGAPFAFAALWESWTPPDGGAPRETAAILTTAPNELVAKIHDRMPAILDEGSFAAWLDPASDDPAPPARLLRPFPAARMTARPLAPHVNDARRDGPECLEPAPPPAPGLFD